MAYLDDYPNLHTLQRKYGVHTAPIEELREAARLDGYIKWENMTYERPTPPHVARRKPRDKRLRRASARLALFATFGISSKGPGADN